MLNIKIGIYDLDDRYKRDVSEFYEVLKVCDACITALENLKSDIETEFPDKAVFMKRDAASLEMVTISRSINREIHKDKVVLGYFCTAASDSGFWEIKDVILDIMNQNQNVYFLIGGQMELPTEFTPVYGRVEQAGFSNEKEVLSLFARTDINLQPIGDTDTYNSAQQNKWLEAALAHVPTAASWNTECKAFIEHEADGYLCRTKEEWKNVLQKLIDDEELRNRMAGNAYEKAVKQHTTSCMEKEIADVLTGRP